MVAAGPKFCNLFVEMLKCAIFCDLGALATSQQAFLMGEEVSLEEQLAVVTGFFISILSGSVIICIVSVIVLHVLWRRHSVSAYGLFAEKLYGVTQGVRTLISLAQEPPPESAG